MEYAICTPKSVPPELRVAAAARAVEINPTNAPREGRLERLFSLITTMVGGCEPKVEKEHLALLTDKRWPSAGVDLSVQFLDNPDAETRRMILSDEIGANAWGKYCRAQFRETNGQGQIRIGRDPNDGYWSFLGTDILSIPLGQATMNLARFNRNTPVGEYRRVVKHEFGHSMGFVHEHMRKELIDRLDKNKVLAYFMRTQGWSPEEVYAQVLRPLSEASIRGTPHADQESIMCYQMPGSLTLDGQPILGGSDIDLFDQQFCASVYPPAVPPSPPPPPPPPPLARGSLVIVFEGPIPPYVIKKLEG